LSSAKWIPDLTPSTPLAQAAQHVLELRLATVRGHLGQALRNCAEDPEHVHHFRVGARRVGAALRVFADCLPGKLYRKSRKKLHRLRDAAGEVRDWDVFRLELAEQAKGEPRQNRAGLDFLIGYALGQREAAQAALEAANHDYPAAFDRLVRKVLVGIRQPVEGPATLIDLARPVVGLLLGKLDRSAARDLEDYDNLHRVRIAGKRLRYALELFAYCYPPVLREVHYTAVEEMQEILGRANDSQVAARRLQALSGKLRMMDPADWKRYRAGIDAVQQFHEQRLPAERRRFEAWWTGWHLGGGQAALTELLGVDGPVRQG
jgi:CHAD domain-containing protein